MDRLRLFLSDGDRLELFFSSFLDADFLRLLALLLRERLLDADDDLLRFRCGERSASPDLSSLGDVPIVPGGGGSKGSVFPLSSRLLLASPALASSTLTLASSTLTLASSTLALASSPSCKGTVGTSVGKGMSGKWISDSKGMMIGSLSSSTTAGSGSTSFGGSWIGPSFGGKGGDGNAISGGGTTTTTSSTGFGGTTTTTTSSTTGFGGTATTASSSISTLEL